MLEKEIKRLLLLACATFKITMKDTLIYIVAHNHREFLKDCFNSVLSQ